MDAQYGTSQAAIDAAWGATLDAIRLVTGPLAPVIVDPGAFTPVTGAAPGLTAPSAATAWQYRGLYAAGKTVRGVSYLAAINAGNDALEVTIPAAARAAPDVLSGQAAPVSAGTLRDVLPPASARLYRLSA